jgi:hypothetical protein
MKTEKEVKMEDMRKTWTGVAWGIAGIASYVGGIVYIFRTLVH